MYQVMYLSRARPGLDPRDVERLSHRSARNNATRGITGMLVCWNGHFLQSLEGEVTAVQDLLDRIRADPRHEGLVVVGAGVLPKRRFDPWSMRVVDFRSPIPAVKAIVTRHPPLDLDLDYYRNPMLAFALLYDVRVHISAAEKAA